MIIPSIRSFGSKGTAIGVFPISLPSIISDAFLGSEVNLTDGNSMGFEDVDFLSPPSGSEDEVNLTDDDSGVSSLHPEELINAAKNAEPINNVLFITISLIFGRSDFYGVLSL